MRDRAPEVGKKEKDRVDGIIRWEILVLPYMLSRGPGNEMILGSGNGSY